MDVIHIGWIDCNVTAFITATTLARHKISTRKIKVNPFITDTDRLSTSIPSNSNDVYYIIGSFNDSDIESILPKKCRISLIGKIYGRKFGDIVNPTKLGTVKIYPVPKKKLHGIEYLSVLMTYFNLSSESQFFLRLVDISTELLKVLTVTNSWIDAFNLFTSNEVVSTPDDVIKVLEHIKRSKGFEKQFNDITTTLRNATVSENKKYVVLDLRNSTIPAKKAQTLLRYVYPNKVVVLLSKDNSNKDCITTLMTKRSVSKEALNIVTQTLNASLIQNNGSTITLRCGLEDNIIEKIKLVAQLLITH